MELLTSYGYKATRLLTSPMRVLPNFIIIGAQKSGTTSLYRYLIQHPSVIPAFHKEIHFFDLNYRKGLFWYKSHFAKLSEIQNLKHPYNQKIITGEATPYYLFHPHVPEKVFEIIPNVKLIVLLRNPVDRAYSHYHHEVKKQVEKLSFEQAIAKETERISEEIVEMSNKSKYYSYNHQHYSYLSRGIYINQIKKWRMFFPDNQIFIINSEKFYKETNKVFSSVLDFLELPIFNDINYEKNNANYYTKMNHRTRKYLTDYFAKPNENLYKYLGVDFGWENN